MTRPAVPPGDDAAGGVVGSGDPGRTLSVAGDDGVDLESVILAEIRVSHPELPLAETTGTLPEATVRLESQARDGSDRPVAFLSVRTGDFDRFEGALLADPTVAEPRIVAALADQRIYRVAVATPLRVVPSRCVALGARPLAVRTCGDGWVVRLRLFARDALDALRSYCLDNGVTYQVRELSRATSRSDEYAFGLTEGQRTTLRLAAEAGYFDVPRRVSQDDLAARLGVSTSAVSQRLRRATASLVEATLTADDRPDE